MKINTFAADSVEEISQKILSASPDFVSLHVSCELTSEEIRNSNQCDSLHGATSCVGAMTQDAVASPIAAFCISDPDGSYGTACRAFEQDPKTASGNAIAAAIEAADRAGEMPDLVWVSATPGCEEDVIEGLQDVVGPTVPIIGGSAADNSVEGNWFVFDQAHCEVDGVVVTVMYPSTPISFAYHSGYSPTGSTGRVTRIDGRRLMEIDGRPAMDVYEEWTGGAIQHDRAADGPRAILGDSTFWPLGRQVSEVSGVPFYVLAHPATAHSDGSIDLFATLNEGEEITLMTGTLESLTERAGRVAQLSRRLMDTPDLPIAGALMIYCGGCMLAVQSHLEQVRSGVTDALGDAPFVGAYTFGEQGYLVDAGNRHGNLMISCIVFSQE